MPSAVEAGRSRCESCFSIGKLEYASTPLAIHIVKADCDFLAGPPLKEQKLDHRALFLSRVHWHFSFSLLWRSHNVRCNE
jgi:hypothetical protein